jgi:hypothetical protein
MLDDASGWRKTSTIRFGSDGCALRIAVKTVRAAPVRRLEYSMTRSFERLVEQQIQKAIAEGKLHGLEGEGQPLPDRSGEAFIDMATAVAARIMAEAGELPEEFKINNLLEAANQSYREAEGDDAKRVAMALIADLHQRYNIAVEARRRFLGS